MKAERSWPDECHQTAASLVFVSGADLDANALLTCRRAGAQEASLQSECTHAAYAFACKHLCAGIKLRARTHMVYAWAGGRARTGVYACTRGHVYVHCAGMSKLMITDAINYC